MATNKNKAQDKSKVSEIDDQIYRFFDIKKRLGKGAYGIVWKAVDKRTSNIVAVKKIFDAFRNETDAQRTFREIMFLRAFKNHPNVIQLYSIHKATNNLDIYLAFEYMESDLHNVIKRGTILKDIHKRYVMYQLFNAIKYIHSGNVIHRDLKPSNVLIDSKCRCKIADFGLARSVSNRPTGDSNTSVDPTEPILTDYVATRWYRAPEILIASKRYTKGIDMWSLGCILGEMIRGKPLFPGSSTVNQIEKIVSSLPEITGKDIEAVGAGFGSVLLNQQNTTESSPNLDELLGGSTDDAKHLVKSLLILNPIGRLTAKEALTHKYIEKFKNSITEAELHTDVLPPFRDDVQLTVPEYRSKLYEIMQTSEKGSEKLTSGVKSINNSNNHKRKETTTAKLDGTILVSSSKQHQNRISPPKSEEKMKREYNYMKYTEKKYQQNHSLPQPTINSNNSNSNNNVNSNGSYHSNNNPIIPSSSNLIKANTIKQNNKESSILHGNNVNSSNNNINSNQIPNDAKLLKPISKLKHAKLSATLPLEKNAQHSANGSSNDAVNHLQQQEHQSPLIVKSGNIKKRNVSLEKRHSIDCTYNCQIASPLQQQIGSNNISAKSNLNGSYSTLNNRNSYLKCSHDNRSNQKDKSDIINNKINESTNLLKHLAIKKSTPTKESNNVKKVDVLVLPNSNNNNVSKTDASYYEKRLRNLEEKFQNHKLDIKTLFHDNGLCRNSKLELNDVKLNKRLSNTESASDEKFLRSKFTLVRTKHENNNNEKSLHISSKYELGHPEGNHLINVKGKDFGITSTNFGKTQVIS